jgi:glycerol kinase
MTAAGVRQRLWSRAEGRVRVVLRLKPVYSIDGTGRRRRGQTVLSRHCLPTRARELTVSQYVLALDQGTTSSRAILFDAQGRPVAFRQQEFEQILPGPGLVEHDPIVLWQTQLDVARAVLQQAGVDGSQVAALGITNQRETTILWERDTGRVVHNAVVWQSRASAPVCERLRADGCEEVFRRKTGLVVDAYFSGTKIKYLFDKLPGLRAAAGRGEILFGTVDTWLLWNLSGGKLHATDMSNASRTLLFNIHTLDWDDELLGLLDVPRAMLPQVLPSSHVYGEAAPQWFGHRIPIAAAAGDQQAATFGQACFQTGSAKNTYGTGCFLLMNVGGQPVASRHGLLTTIGWCLDNQVTYCLEGAVFIAGAIVQWLRDGLRILERSADVEQLAAAVPDAGGVYCVPALVGLGAPYWDPYARGLIIGLERGTRQEHIARAALESMAYQTRDILDAMQRDSGLTLAELKVDGGAAANNLLMQFQADLLGTRVRRPRVAETTALGAAYLAGLAVGYWRDRDEVARHWALDREFQPAVAAQQRDAWYRNWQRAVQRALRWVEP